MHSTGETLANEVVARAYQLEVELVRTQERLAIESIELEQLRRRFDSLRSEKLQQRSVNEGSAGNEASPPRASETVALRNRIRELETELEILSGRFLVQTEEAIEETRRERERLETLAQVVRTSKFWKLKSFLRRAMLRTEHARRA